MADLDKDQDTLTDKTVVTKDQETLVDKTPPAPEPDETLKKLGYTSWDEVGKALGELRGKLGDQGNELGDLRKREKQMTEMLEKANQVITGLVDTPEAYQPPTSEQKAAFMQRFYADPLLTMSDIASGTTGKQLEKINKLINELASKLHRQDIIEERPAVKEFSPTIQGAIMGDKTGKLAADIVKMLDEAVVKTKKEVDVDKDKKTVVKGRTTVLTPGPDVKMLNSEEEYEAEMQDAIKKGDTQRVSRLIASRLNEQ